VQDWFTCNSQLELLKCSLALFCRMPLHFLLQQISKRSSLLRIGSYEFSVIIGQAKERLKGGRQDYYNLFLYQTGHGLRFPWIFLGGSLKWKGWKL